MRIEKQIGEKLIVVNCSDGQVEQVRSLIKKFTELSAIPPGLQDGTIIRFGWSDLKLKQQGEELVVCEPDFKRNPLRDYIESVTNTLDVLTQQVFLLKQTGANGLTCSYSQKVAISKGVLEEQEIYLQRSTPYNTTDSGWFIGEATRNDRKLTSDDLELKYIYEIFQVRPELMKVLALPVGYMAVFDGDRLKAVLDNKGTNLLK